MTVRDTILADALDLFQDNGITHLSESQIRGHVGISKATFQEYFQDKRDLVFQTVQYFLQKQKYEREKLLRQAYSASDATTLLLQNTVHRIRSIKPSFYTDLQHHFPEAWNLYLQYLHKDAYRHVYAVIRRGIESGEFRRDINIELVSKITIELFLLLLNPEVFPHHRYNLLEVYRSIFFYYFRGFCTPNHCREIDDFFSHL